MADLVVVTPELLRETASVLARCAGELESAIGRVEKLPSGLELRKIDKVVAWRDGLVRFVARVNAEIGVAEDLERLRPWGGSTREKRRTAARGVKK